MQSWGAVSDCFLEMSWLLHLCTHSSRGQQHRTAAINCPSLMGEGLIKLRPSWRHKEWGVTFFIAMLIASTHANNHGPMLIRAILSKFRGTHTHAHTLKKINNDVIFKILWRNTVTYHITMFHSAMDGMHNMFPWKLQWNLNIHIVVFVEIMLETKLLNYLL